MARRRMIEVSIAHDKALNSLPDFEQALYLKILPHTDDYGRFEGDAEILKARVDPLSRRRTSVYEAALRRISEAGLIFVYETETKRRVIQFKQESFERINAFLIKKRGNSEYPEFNKDLYKVISGDMIYKVISIKQKEESKKTTESEKILFADDVMLTQVEYDKLKLKIGSEAGLKYCIEILSNYKGAKGAKYKSDYKAILNWVISEYEKRKGQNPQLLKSGSLKLYVCPQCKKEMPTSKQYEHWTQCEFYKPPSKETLKQSLSEVKKATAAKS